MISAIDFIIMQNRIYKSNGVSFRRISEVAEVVGIEEGTVQLNKIFEWNPEKDIIENVSISSKTLNEIAKMSGNSLKEIYNEIENRKLLIDYMLSNNIRSIYDVKKLIEKYYIDSNSLLNKIILEN
jgi:flagellar protein FlaI